jgi:prophage antirepressor-like protein
MNSAFNLELIIPDEVCQGGMKIRMAGTPDEPLFCLADICKVLGLGNAPMVAERLAEDEKTTISFSDSAGGLPRIFVTEPGLYVIVFRSSKPQAEVFRRWVMHDVLPSIRKHGCYPPPDATALAPPPQVLPAWSQRLSRSFRQHYAYINRNHPGWWSVLVAFCTPCLALEDVLIRHCLPVNLSDRPDTSVGLKWASYRRSLRMPEPVFAAPLCLPDQGMIVDVSLYGPEERGVFDFWLTSIYIAEHCRTWSRSTAASSASCRL